jgi:hypothetical protein
MTPRAHRALRGIRALLADYPHLEPIAVPLVRAQGAPAALDDLRALARFDRSAAGPRPLADDEVRHARPIA